MKTLRVLHAHQPAKYLDISLVGLRTALNVEQIVEMS